MTLTQDIPDIQDELIQFIIGKNITSIPICKTKMSKLNYATMYQIETAQNFST